MFQYDKVRETKFADEVDKKNEGRFTVFESPQDIEIMRSKSTGMRSLRLTEVRIRSSHRRPLENEALESVPAVRRVVLPLPRRGVLYQFAAGSLTALLTLVVKELSQGTQVSPFEIAAVRCALLLLAVTFYNVVMNKERGSWATYFGTPTVFPLLVLRGLLGYLGNLFLYFSIEYLSLGDANIIFFTSPIWSALLARVLLGERTSIRTYCVVFFCLFGVVLTARPWESTPGKQTNLFGIGLAICGSIVSGLVGVVLRGAKDVPWNTIMQMHFLTEAVVGSLNMWFMSQVVGLKIISTKGLSQEPSQAWIAVLFVGVISFTAQMMMTRGSKYEKASVAAAARTIDIPVALVLQAVILKNPVNPFSWLGGITIILGLVVLMFSKKKTVVLSQDSDCKATVEFSERCSFAEFDAQLSEIRKKKSFFSDICI